MLAEQLEWLMIIKDHIAASASISIEDFELFPFYERGGVIRFRKAFGMESDIILEELNEVLVA